MNGGAKSFVLLMSLAATGCETAPKAIAIRPLANPADKIRAGSAGLADARAQLALGNVGLALEAFRKALRETPDNPEAYAGIAKCYKSMGRYDLARQNYETALAFAPKDPGLLGGFTVAAATAASPVRSEAAAIATQPVQAAPPAHRDLPPSAVDVAGARGLRIADRQLDALAAGPSITVELPPARPAAVATTTVAPIQRQAAVAAAPPRRPCRPWLIVSCQVPPSTCCGAGILLAVRQLQALAAAGPSITVDLPPAQPARRWTRRTASGRLPRWRSSRARASSA